MKKVFKWVGIVLLVLIAAFLIVPVFLPAHHHVERSIVIDRPPQDVFAVVTDFNQSKNWDPWVETDPTIQAKVTGTGVGSTYEWEGKDAGKGKLTIVKAESPTLVELDAVMYEPMEGTFKPGWQLAPVDGGTKLTWTFDQDSPGYLMRWCGLMCEPMIGGTFEKGLGNLKAYVEKK